MMVLKLGSCGIKRGGNDEANETFIAQCFNDDIQYDMGVEISHVDNISGEWPVENDGYLKTPSSSVPDDDPAWWDWNA